MDVTSVSRIVVVDEGEHSRVVSDGPPRDVLTDPARPGFASARIWTTDRTPARLQGVREQQALPQRLEPQPGGSVCRIVTFPPEGGFLSKVSGRDVQAYFAAAGSPAASTYAAAGPHPYMQKNRTLEFCLILDGEITLILDKEEVSLKAGDTVVQRGTNHAWSNRSDRPCTMAISSHDAE
jgi:uncharacterized cupin superfamily protein